MPHKIIWKIILFIVLMFVSCVGYTELSSMISADNDIQVFIGVMGFIGLIGWWFYFICWLCSKGD